MFCRQYSACRALSDYCDGSQLDVVRHSDDRHVVEAVNDRRIRGYFTIPEDGDLMQSWLVATHDIVVDIR